MADADDYESLPPTSSMSTHMLAGAAAGIMEYCVMYPVDCVKTRMQILVPDPRADYRNILHAFYRIVRYEGLHMTVRGMSATVYGAGPAHALYYSSYEKIKALLSRADHSNHVAHGIAGCVATVLHDAIMTPADVVKQRMQVFNSPYKSCVDCIHSIHHSEGIRAFYRSYGTQLTMNVPFVSLHFVVYESAQDLLNPARQYNPLSHVVSGAAAGAIAAAATTPLDVCKTLLNTQTAHAAGSVGSNAGFVVNGLVQAVATVYRCRGVRGYFSGVTARIVFQTPATAISWSVYEFFKFAITHYSRHDESSSTAIPVSFLD